MQTTICCRLVPRNLPIYHHAASYETEMENQQLLRQGLGLHYMGQPRSGSVIIAKLLHNQRMIAPTYVMFISQSLASMKRHARSNVLRDVNGSLEFSLGDSWLS